MGAPEGFPQGPRGRMHVFRGALWLCVESGFRRARSQQRGLGSGGCEMTSPDELGYLFLTSCVNVSGWELVRWLQEVRTQPLSLLLLSDPKDTDLIPMVPN